MEVPFFRDLSTYFYPLRYSLYESFNTGEIILWNRHMAMGFPQLADFQSGVFYPPHLILKWLPFFTAIRVLFIVHFLVAGIGAYCLFRHWSYPVYLAVVGALLFALGGTIVSLSNLLNHFQAAVWLPCVIVLWEKVVSAPRWGTFVALTLGTAVQFLAGSPEIFVMSMALVLLDGLRLKVSGHDISLAKMVGIFCALGIVVAGLAMVQLLPTAELFSRSRRQLPIPFIEATHWSLNPLNLINLFFLDKEVDTTLPLGASLFFNHDTPFLVTYYLGAVSLLGLCLWFCFVSLRERIILLFLITGSLLVAFGHFTPFYKILFEQLPIFASVRFPEKFFFITYALLIVAVMRGLLAFVEADAPTAKWPLMVVGAVCSVLLVLYGLLRLNTDVIVRFTASTSGIPLLSAATAKNVASVFVNMERQVALSFGIFFLLLLAKRNIIRGQLFAVLLVAAVFVDLAWAHRSFLYPLDPGFVNSSRIIDHPLPNFGRIFYYPSRHNLHPSTLTVLGRPSYQDATALAFRTLLPNAGVLSGFDYMQEIDALGRQPYAEFLDVANQLEPARQIKLLRSFNIAYLVSFRELSIEGITLVKKSPEYFAWLYRIEKPRPRTYMVNKSFVAKDSRLALQRMASDDFDPAGDLVLEQPISINPKREFDGSAAFKRYENGFVKIETSSNSDGILVLTDSYYPGWHALVDGKEEMIVRANHFFRAVRVPQGEHVVEFRYEPRSFLIGLAVSILTVLVITMVSIIVFLRRPKRIRIVSC